MEPKGFIFDTRSILYHTTINYSAVKRQQERNKMAVDIGNTVKAGVSSGLAIVKTFVIPLVIGAIVVGIICGAFPAAQKLLK